MIKVLWGVILFVLAGTVFAGANGYPSPEGYALCFFLILGLGYAYDKQDKVPDDISELEEK